MLVWPKVENCDGVCVGSTITGPTDGLDRVEFSVWIFLRAKADPNRTNRKI